MVAYKKEIRYEREASDPIQTSIEALQDHFFNEAEVMTE